MTIAEQVGVTLRWIDTSEVVLGDTVVQQALHPEWGVSHRDRILGRLGIARRDGEGHLAAWMRVMAEENGLPHTEPCVRELLDAIEQGGVMRFVFVLA